MAFGALTEETVQVNLECEENNLAPYKGWLCRPLVATGLKPLLIFSATGTCMEVGNRGVQKWDSIDPLTA